MAAAEAIEIRSSNGNVGVGGKRLVGDSAPFAGNIKSRGVADPGLMAELTRRLTEPRAAGAVASVG